MFGSVFTCLYQRKAYVEFPNDLWSTTIEFIFISLVILCGVTLNKRFLVRLKEEKRQIPPGRKGNVIEPIVRWYCIFEIVYWPCRMMFFWIRSNEILHFDQWNGWWFNVLQTIYIILWFGRPYLSWNSLFVASIRFVYIVYQQTSKKWEFEKVGRLFRISSVVVPIVSQSIGLFTHNFMEVQSNITPKQELIDCIASNSNVSSNSIQIPYAPYPLKWTLTIVPEPICKALWITWLAISFLVYSNFIELFMYFKMFRTIKR